MPSLRWLLLAVSSCACLPGAAVAADPSPAAADMLSREELSVCARQVGSLRTQSEQALAHSARLEAERKRIDVEYADIVADRHAVDPDDSTTADDFSQRLAKHQDKVQVFNMDMVKLRDEIAAANQLKQQYDQNCAARNFQHSDLEKLPAEERAAMQRGTQGLQVPYVNPAAVR